MKARLRYRIKEAYGRGMIEAMIREVPQAVRRSTHRIKYRLVYVVNGERVVGYDNERGKGDHRHLHGAEMRYAFKDVPTLLHDFLRDVKEMES